MSDQRRTDLSQAVSKSRPSPAPADEAARHSGLKKRLPYYAAAAIVVICALAWIDGGEEPLHPITQAVDLTKKAGGA